MFREGFSVEGGEKIDRAKTDVEIFNEATKGKNPEEFPKLFKDRGSELFAKGFVRLKGNQVEFNKDKNWANT